MFFKKKQHILILCTPKSGSTYLLRLLESLLSYKVKIFIPAFDRTEQDVFEPEIINSLKINTVSHQHTRCTNNNIRLLNKHKIKPVILTRNIFDSVISMRNHMILEPESSWWPMAYIDHNFYSLSTEKQYDFVIDLIIPWYINFYVSWQRYQEKNSLLWITYEELFTDKLAVLKKILDYYGIKKDITLMDVANHENFIKGKTRKTNLDKLNKEIKLSEEQINKIKTLTNYYGDIDFSKLGIV
jgi:hypothetical protein